MILGKEKTDVNVSGNFKTSSFKIQTNAKAFEILSSNIYTYKVKAVIREISCNARDSHVAAANPNPFKTHLPTTLEPWFSVRDYGIGLSDQDVREIFSTYFCSTKTSSNDFVGALGLGSKSPFCLVDSFTVISFYNNKKRTYSCFKDENSEPQVALLTEEDTSEHNGVEVIISVEDKLISEFDAYAAEVYSYFDQIPAINKTSVLDKIKNIRDSYIFTNEDFAFCNGYGNTKAVMGGVAYEIPAMHDKFHCNGYIKFKMGEISFDAGRESLSLDEKTIKAIANKSDQIKGRVIELIIDEIEKETTPFKKLVKARKMGELSFVDSTKLFAKYPNPICADLECWSRSYRSTEQSKKERLPIGENISYYKFKPRFTGRIKEYLKTFRHHTIVLLTDEQVKTTQIDEDILLDLDTLPKISKCGIDTVTSKVKVFKFNPENLYYHSNKDKWTEVSVYNDTNEKIYVEINRWDVINSSFAHMTRAIEVCSQTLKSTIDIYGVKTAFLSTKEFNNGNWISLDVYMNRELAKKYSGASVYDIDISWHEERMFTFLRTNFSNIDTVAELSSIFNKHKKQAEMIRLCDQYCVNLNKDSSFHIKFEELKSRYPMLLVVDNFPNPTNNDTEFNIIKQYINGVDQNEKKN